MTVAVALTVGLLQGFAHCAGMCGPFVLAFGLALPRPEAPRRGLSRVVALHAMHNAGRIATFSALGLAFGWLGSFVSGAARLTGLQAAAGLAGGALMLAWAVDQVRTGHGASALERWSLLRLGVVGRGLRGLLGRSDPLGAFGCGALLGLHPCGLIFAMLLAAAAADSPWRGALILAAFGLGTVPALVGVASVAQAGGGRLRGRAAAYGSAALVGLSGALFVLRGLAVNGWVPNVWPWLF